MWIARYKYNLQSGQPRGSFPADYSEDADAEARAALGSAPRQASRDRFRPLVGVTGSVVKTARALEKKLTGAPVGSTPAARAALAASVSRASRGASGRYSIVGPTTDDQCLFNTPRVSSLRQASISGLKRAREDAPEGADAAAAGGSDGTMVGRHRGEVRGLAVDALSRTVVSASLDRTLRFWRRAATWTQ